MRIHRILGVAAALAVCLPVLPSVAQISEPTIEIADTATIVLNGTAVGVTLSLQCAVEAPVTYGDALVYARSGNAIASGFGQLGSSNPYSAVAQCGPDPTTVTIVIPSSTVPFHPGSAYVRASLSVCDPDVGYCLTGYDEENVRLSKK